jgi:hypothetical protein
MTSLDDLDRKLSDKEREIAAVYANATGRDIARLSESERSVLDVEVSNLIDEADEALIDGETAEHRRARDPRFAATSIGRLVLERHEIEEQILDELESN